MRFFMSYNYEFLHIVDKIKVPEAYKMVPINIKLAKLLDHKGLSDLKWMSDLVRKAWLREASTAKMAQHYFISD